MSSFSKISADTLTRVDQGDLAAAQTLINDLELAWDRAEAGLKRRAAVDWHRIDNDIDGALKALRADAPMAADCQQALTQLQHSFASLAGKR